IPLHPDLESWLLDAPQASAFVFPTLSQRRMDGVCGLSGTFSRMVKTAGIDGGLMREKQGRCGKNVSSLTFHSLRHSFTSALVKAGVSAEVRMKMTGHTDS